MAEQPMEPLFNRIYDTYDNIRFVRGPAERLVEKTKIRPGQRVLDIACGTGWATMNAARSASGRGKVIGIDVAEKMLDVARRKADTAGLSNIEYQPGFAESLEFSDASFDAVICASSIFLFRDIIKALREWRRVLKPGGKVAFSSFGPDFMQPYGRLLIERLGRYLGQAPPPGGSGRTDTAEKCRGLLKSAGFKKIEITTEQLGGYMKDAKDYWQEITSTIARVQLDRLGPAQLEKFKEEHLAEVEPLRTEKGIWIDVLTLFSVATK